MATIQLHALSSSDGSAIYISPTSSHTILAGVNYPLEVQYRSKELPGDTYIEVALRPHNGVGMVKERHVEELVRRVLQSVVLGQETPRCMLQVTLQIADVEADESLPGGVKGGGQGESYLETLAGAINAAVAGCLDAGVQMKGIAGACLVAISKQGEIVAWPTLKQKKVASSLHVLAYARGGECLLMESEGSFAVGEWEQAENAARIAVTGISQSGEDTNMEDSTTSLFDQIRRAVEVKVEKDGRWRGG